jgi:hypothetical protein
MKRRDHLKLLLLIRRNPEYKYVARDEDGLVYAYITKPSLGHFSWYLGHLSWYPHDSTYLYPRAVDVVLDDRKDWSDSMSSIKDLLWKSH